MSIVISLLVDPSYIIPIPFVVRKVLSNIRFNHYEVSRTKVVEIWKVAKNVETNWESGVIHHMINNKRKDIWLPFGGLITNFSEHSRFNLEDEDTYQDYTKI